MSNSKRVRPTMFTVGVGLTAAQAVLVILVVGVGFLASTLGLSLGAIMAKGEAWIPLAALGGGLALFFSALLFVNLALLYVCWQAWEGGSGWIVALMVLSGFHALAGGPFAAVVGVITLVGCVQLREQLERDSTPST